MKKLLRVLFVQVFFYAVLMYMVGDLTMASQDYQDTPIILNAKDVLPTNLLKGDNYQVENEVKNDGVINTYELKTDYGQFKVEGTATLLMRIQEIKALKVMEELDRQDVFGDAVVAGVKAPVKGAVALVTSPVETSKGIAKGTGRFISNLGRSIFSDDPDQDNAFKVALGYDAAKRQFAYEFGIDPYSDNQPVMDRLSEIAQAAVAGGLAPRAALASIGGGVATGISLSATAESMRKLVRDNTPGELRKINKAKLEKMGLDSSLIEAFLDNYRFNPQEETLLVGELEAMKGVKGLDTFIRKASLVTDKDRARFERLIAQMMAGYYANVDSNVQLVNAGGSLALRKKDGTLVFPGPLDYIFWTKIIEDKLTKLDNEIQKVYGVSVKELWITGEIDRFALKHLEARGWKVEENAHEVLFNKSQ